MCGFIGFFNRNDNITPAQAGYAAAMSKLIAHRGPDQDGILTKGRISFAFRRLSIVDLEHGSQPYTSADGRYTVVYNGEIYNYLELRKPLEEKGVVFNTNSEVETMCELYRAYGEGFVAMLRGMFAFLIYDNETAVLLAARDPFGIKPLYYRETADGCVFASEMKAYAADGSYDGFKVDSELLQHYFTFQYVTEPDTICGDIKIVPQGSFMVCDADGDRITTYYKPVFAPNKSIKYDEKKCMLREAVEKSVEHHMMSDVPVGAFLSSGIDSAVVVALASKLQPGIKAFTVGFDVNGYSELDDAAEIAAHLNVEHIKVQCTLDDFTDNYEKVIYHLDSPVADPSVVAIYLVAREAAKHVKVVLTGEGSDELFGGYRQYATVLSASRLAHLPQGIKKALLAFANCLPDGVKGKNYIRRGCIPIEDRFVGNSFLFDENEKTFLKTRNDGVRFTDRTRDIYAAGGDYTPLLKMQHCDLHTWLASDILVKGDRLTMANSLEARVPYLDKEVFKVASLLCDGDKLKKGTTKYILRDTFADLLNSETVMRPKLGYPVPVRVWLKNELYDWARSIILENPAEEYIDANEALKLLDAHRAGKADLYHQIWSILTFETWTKIFLTGDNIRLFADAHAHVFPR